MLVLFHGLRLGEALALKGRHVNTATPAVTVEATLVRIIDDNGKTRTELHESKTSAGYRTVPIVPEFRHVLREHVATYHPGPGDFLTTTTIGKPVLDTSYRSVFNRAKHLAGAPDNLTPHYGRVYVTTRLAEAGATPKEIGLLLGQSDVSTITGVYMRARAGHANSIMKHLNYG